ncbi:hypothetical protein DPEC_G00256300 [Dallia pectoralis]|uniref:Uncharacterized protein n=1 Tax=Dallia pectoralis TaxID=75939 RepID=A0ACC2FQF0_DALPE|nr:hypothetical protein DPEC_G00256300 [Dallia pectoralis]
MCTSKPAGPSEDHNTDSLPDPLTDVFDSYLGLVLFQKTAYRSATTLELGSWLNTHIHSTRRTSNTISTCSITSPVFLYDQSVWKHRCFLSFTFKVWMCCPLSQFVNDKTIHSKPVSSTPICEG